MAEKPTLDELGQRGSEALWMAEQFAPERVTPEWCDATTRAVLEAAGVPALLAERDEFRDKLSEALLREGAIAVERNDQRERAESAEARVADLEADLNQLGTAFARLYLQALNGVVCDPTGHAGTRGCCRVCHEAWASGKTVLDSHDPGWGGLQRAHVFRVGEPQVGGDRHSTVASPALPDPREK
jgi:hypothetical protein